jgi:hypothetical protein
MSKSTKTTDKPQIDRFKEAARALGCDENEAAFDGKLKVIAKQKPKIEKPKD